MIDLAKSAMRARRDRPKLDPCRLGRTLLALLLCVPPAYAAQNVPPPPQDGPLLITGATLHTVSGPVIENGRMLIDRGRIVAVVGPNEPLSAPALSRAQTLDLKGRHVYPGFIAANSALGLVEVIAVRATTDTAETGAINPGSRALVAINADSELLPVARANGVLAALAVPRATPTGLIAGTSSVIQLDGWNWEEMGIAPAVGLHVRLPSLRLNRELYPPPLDLRLEELRKFTAQRLRMLEDAFDAAQAYRRARAGDPGLPLDSRWEAVLPVLEGQRPVFMHANELPQIRYALGFAERYGVRLVIVGGDDAWRIADVLRERRVPVIVTGVHALPQRRGEDYDTQFRLPARLAAAGVTFCIARGGSEFDAPRERNLPYVAATAVAHGLPREQALRAITLYPAQILGVADQLGSLAPGRLASFFVADGDPLEVTTRIERVFIQGREVDLSNRQTRLNDKYEQRYRQRGAQKAAQ
ncbi:MAG TPA: amidohydrolase family protein [Burkholderiaceae bacterium]|nr:amidohydrolase family protein [Burkholderiaceae bacterium]